MSDELQLILYLERVVALVPASYQPGTDQERVTGEEYRQRHRKSAGAHRIHAKPQCLRADQHADGIAEHERRIGRGEFAPREL